MPWEDGKASEAGPLHPSSKDLVRAAAERLSREVDRLLRLGLDPSEYIVLVADAWTRWGAELAAGELLPEARSPAEQAAVLRGARERSLRDGAALVVSGLVTEEQMVGLLERWQIHEARIRAWVTERPAAANSVRCVAVATSSLRIALLAWSRSPPDTGPN
ncbi:MAG: hypothetical protein JOZ69_11260 [Myxococcales bacterium]|nr:hypothetical protein [Myxococcales bacterium]